MATCKSESLEPPNSFGLLEEGWAWASKNWLEATVIGITIAICMAVLLALVAIIATAALALFPVGIVALAVACIIGAR